MKKRYLANLASALAISILVGGCVPKQPVTEPSSVQTESVVESDESLLQENSDTKNEEAPDLKDDFYGAVNYEQFNEWEIPAHLSEMSWFGLLEEENYKRINDEIKAAASAENLTEGSDAWNVGALYLTGLDKDKRNQEGFGEAVGGFIDAVDGAESVSELIDVTLSFQRKYGFYSLCGFSYAPDLEDSTKKVLYASRPDMGMSKEIWFSDEKNNQENVDAFVEYLEKLQVQAGAAEEEAKKNVEQVTGMMKDLAQASLSIEEQYDAEKTYNVYSVGELPDFLLNGLVTAEQLEQLYGADPDEMLIIQDEGVAKCLSSWLTEENLPLLKEYVKTCIYSDTSVFREIEAQEIYQEYESKTFGTEPLDFERFTSENVQGILGFQCGKLFCDRYFSEESKKEVEELVQEVVDAYKTRIDQLDWMTDATKAGAKKKLSTMTSAVGYPDSWPQDKYELSLNYPKDGGLYIDNYFQTVKAMLDYEYSVKDEPVDKKEWLMAPQIINAYYYPSANSITLLAGILQEPFYSADASDEEKLGAIGTVIAHEITHAFDTNGSQYDENGNLRNWWTEEDYENFQTLAAQVESYYSGMEIEGRQVNGTLTLIENIADLGAVACVTQIAEEKGYDLETVYRSYANNWAEKMREEYMVYLLTTDVHSLGKIRTNAVLSAIDEFYEVFGIQEGDGMYQKPENRPKIW